MNKVLGLAGWSSSDTGPKRLLEIGCGVGRMTRHFAGRFAHVTAVDVSGEMIRKARELNGHLPNVRFEETSGTDLRAFPDASFDAVLSYIVFQHIPSRQIIYGYVDEALRVLRPEGSFFFQARNDFAHQRTGTYQGDSVELPVVESIAARYNRPILSVQGRGQHYCYVHIGPR